MTDENGDDDEYRLMAMTQFFVPLSLLASVRARVCINYEMIVFFFVGMTLKLNHWISHAIVFAV